MSRGMPINTLRGLTEIGQMSESGL